MAWDIATHPLTGDWLFAANRDLQHVEGEHVVAQRIRHRLRVVKRTWILDPTDGELGSNLERVTRLPRARAVREAQLSVEEALAPMPDVEVTDIRVIEGTTSLTIEIDYQIISGTDFVPLADRLSETLTFELPA